MKRIYLIFISLGIVMLSACSTGDSSSSADNDNSSSSNLLMIGTLDPTRVIETDAGAGGVNTSSMKTSWANTDEMVVVYNAGTSGSPSYQNATFMTTSAATGYFKSTGTSFNTQAKINGYINNPAIAMNTTNGSDTITTTQSSTSYKLTSTVKYLGNQDGTLGNVSHYDLLYGSSISNGTSQKPFTFHHAMSVIRIDITNLPVAATYVKSATITYTPTGSTPQLLATSESYTYDGTTLAQSSVASATSITMTFPTGTNKVVVSSGGKASIYLVVPGSTTTNAYTGTLSVSVTTDDNNIRVSNVSLSSKTLKPGSLYAKSVAMVVNGMFYFSDGTWGRLGDYPSKTPIAVVFYTATSDNDKAKWTHGYAMALKNAATSVNWGPYGTEESLSNSLNDRTLLEGDLDGYTNTQTIKKLSNFSSSTYPAFYAALNYSVSAPTTSSGWYLPSSGQWYWLAIDLCKLGIEYSSSFTLNRTSTTTTTPNETGVADQWTRTSGQSTATDINGYLNLVSGSDLFVDGTWFWDSTEASNYSGGVFQLNSSTVTTLQRTLKNKVGYVRPVLAF